MRGIRSLLHAMSFLPTPAGQAGTISIDTSGDAEAFFTAAKRRERRRRLGGLGVVVVVCAAGLLVYALGFRAGSTKTSSSGTAGVAKSTQTLARCIEAWNRARLGNGRSLADAAGGDGPEALMFASTDAVCGVAFPSGVSTAAGLSAVFVSEVGGDYLLDESPGLPVGENGPSIAARLEAVADQGTNVRVQIPSGRIAAKRHATMPIVPLRLLDSSADCREIPVLLYAATTDAPTKFKLLTRTVSCPDVRAIIWAWSAAEALHAGASEPPSAQLIAGWRCAGADFQRSPDWGTYMLVTCGKNNNSFAVRDVPPRTTSQLGAPHTDS
jgi:hypothetical protein